MTMRTFRTRAGIVRRQDLVALSSAPGEAGHNGNGGSHGLGVETTVGRVAIFNEALRPNLDSARKGEDYAAALDPHACTIATPFRIRVRFEMSLPMYISNTVRSNRGNG